ncbi:hypothetical protein SBA3_1010028 [Candidatus Sulfopaludibacter sp. SbA3]|nr:hypothetical protein SBA3_1010028 [Candidatus Sulfopaludibacter sp. SbA3]
MSPQTIELETDTQRDPRAFNAYRHGLTGQVMIMTPADELAYSKHCQDVLASLGVEGDIEKKLAQSIADDQWRLFRSAAIDHTRFTLGMSDPDKIHAHHPEIDAALAQAVVWASEAKNLNLMSLYESRAQRRIERNMKMLKQQQDERKAAFDRAVEEATLLAQYAASKGEAYNVESDFPPEALPPQFVFSLPKIARRVTHNRRVADAQKHFPAPKHGFRRAA